MQCAYTENQNLNLFFFWLIACDVVRRLFVHSEDGNPMLRQGDTGDWVGTFEGHKGAVWGVALNKTATLAASGAADFSGKETTRGVFSSMLIQTYNSIISTGKVWNAGNGEELHSFKHKHIVKSVSFDQDSNYLVTGSNEKLIRVFDLSQPNASPQVYAGHGGAVKRALFCRNDKYIVSVAEDKTLRLWDRSIGQEVQRIEFSAHPNSIELSSDYNILTVTHGNCVSFLETDTLKKMKEITVPTNVATASLHPDKHIFVCGGEDFKMYKYDYITGNEIGKGAAGTKTNAMNQYSFFFNYLIFYPQNRSKDISGPFMRLASVRMDSFGPVALRMVRCVCGKRP